jgi:cytochrome c-type biogenesis protein CcmH/NrfF
MTRSSAPGARARVARVVFALIVGCLVALVAAPAASALSVTTVPTRTATAATAPTTTTARPAVPPRTTLREVEKELMCSTCRVPLEQSEAPQAQQERQTIERLIAEGLTKDQIIDEMVEIYSESVLIHPPEDGVRTLRWLVPAVAALIGFSLAFFLVVRWRRSTRASGTTRPSDPTAGWVDAPTGSPSPEPDSAAPNHAPSDGLSDADRARLDADLDRYA